MSPELRIGAQAPDFHAEVVGGKYGNGQTVSLGDFRGSIVVLYFYPKDDTPGCTVQACSLRDEWDELYGKKYMGTERSTFVIDGEGRISAILRKVKPDQHSALLQEALSKVAT